MTGWGERVWSLRDGERQHDILLLFQIVGPHVFLPPRLPWERRSKEKATSFSTERAWCLKGKKLRKCWRKEKISFSDEQSLEGIRSVLGKIKLIYTNTLPSKGPRWAQHEVLMPSTEGMGTQWLPALPQKNLKNQAENPIFLCLLTCCSSRVMYLHKETWLFLESHPKNQLCCTTVCSMTHVTIFTSNQAVRGNKAKTQLKWISWNMVFSSSFLLNLDFPFSENEWHLKPVFSPVNVKINTDSLIFCKPTLFVFWVAFLFTFELEKNTVRCFSPVF